jgi:hypothetical protein
MCLQFGFLIFWQKDFGAKAAHKMLVKLTPGGNTVSRHICSFIHWKITNLPITQQLVKLGKIISTDLESFEFYTQFNVSLTKFLLFLNENQAIYRKRHPHCCPSTNGQAYHVIFPVMHVESFGL